MKVTLLDIPELTNDMSLAHTIVNKKSDVYFDRLMNYLKSGICDIQERLFSNNYIKMTVYMGKDKYVLAFTRNTHNTVLVDYYRDYQSKPYITVECRSPKIFELIKSLNWIPGSNMFKDELTLVDLSGIKRLE